MISYFDIENLQASISQKTEKITKNLIVIQKQDNIQMLKIKENSLTDTSLLTILTKNSFTYETFLKH